MLNGKKAKSPHDYLQITNINTVLLLKHHGVFIEYFCKQMCYKGVSIWAVGACLDRPRGPRPCFQQALSPLWCWGAETGP